MDKVRLGIVGLGNMGSIHAASLLAGEIGRVALAAVCDSDPARIARFPGVPGFASVEAMVASRTVDAVHTATPHSAIS